MHKPVSMVSEPNMVPMIDVLLVLLIIFMLVTVESVRRAFLLQLPQPASASGPASVPMVLTVAAGPQYTLNGKRLVPDRLESELRSVFARRTERVLFVRGERTMRYQEVIHAFDAARGAGIGVTAIVPETAR
ncbi:MAG: biopolymer transporter ExbD [Cytophagaceae bacterium]|nr:biopolymer transporter ExbD [Gemmatimonadaceae bacterium]